MYQYFLYLQLYTGIIFICEISSKELNMKLRSFRSVQRSSSSSCDIFVQVAHLIDQHEEKIVQKLKLENLLNDPIWNLHVHSSEREDELDSEMNVSLKSQRRAFKFAQIQLISRIDSLMRCNRGLSNSLDHYRRIVKSVEFRLKKTEFDLVQNLPSGFYEGPSDDTLDDIPKDKQPRLSEPPLAKNKRCRSSSKETEQEPVQFCTIKQVDQTTQANLLRSAPFGRDKALQTDIECSDTPEKVTKVHNQSRTQLPSTRSELQQRRSGCCLDEVSAVKSFAQRIKTNIDRLLITASNLDLPSVNVALTKQSVKSQALNICTDWKRLEPKITALCDERSKFAAGVEMLRKQLNDLQQVKGGNGFIRPRAGDEMKPEADNIRQITANRVKQIHQTSQTGESRVTSSSQTDEPQNFFFVPRASVMTQTYSAVQMQANDSEHLSEVLNLSRREVERAEKEVQVDDESSKNRLFQKKYKSKLEKAQIEVQSLTKEVQLLHTNFEQAQQAFSDEKKDLMLSFKKKLEEIHQKDIEEATAPLKQNIEQLSNQLKEEVALHTAQFEALLKEHERTRSNHEQVIRHYEVRLAEAVSQKSAAQRSVQLIDPNYNSNSEPTPNAHHIENRPCSECIHLKTTQKQLEMARDQLSLANSKCRELRHELHRALNENRAHQEDTARMNSRSRSPSVSDMDHENAVAKLESKLQQCRAQIKSLSNLASASSSATKEVSDLKFRLESMKRNINEKEKRIKSLLASIGSRDKVIEDLNSRLRSTSEDDSELKETIHNLQEKVNRCSLNLTSKQSLLKDLQEKLKRCELECEQKDIQLESMRRCKSALQKKESILSEIQRNLDHSVLHQKKLEESIQHLEEQLNQSQKTIHQLEKDVKLSKATKSYLEDVLRAVSEYLLSCNSRLKEENDLFSVNVEAISSFSKELQVDPSMITKTLPEFTLLDLKDLLSPSNHQDEPRVDYEATISELIRGSQGKQVVIDRLKGWIDERVQLECKRLSVRN